MTSAALLAVGLLAAGELDLPHLVVEGSARIPAPQRDYWASPQLSVSSPPPLPSPRLSGLLGEAPAGPLRRPPPAGFSILAGGGVAHEGTALVGIGEVAGGIAAEAWRCEAGDLDRRGVRATALVSGRWGSAVARVQHWADRRDGVEVEPGWVFGSVVASTPLGARAAIQATLTVSDPHGDGVHGEATLFARAPRLGLPFELTAGDRVFGGVVSWRHEGARIALRAGPAMVDDGTPRWAAQGAASVGPLVWKRVAVTLAAERRVRLVDGATLRAAFPVARGIPARAELVPWSVEAQARVRVARRMTVAGSVAARSIETAPAWRDTEDGWVSESLSGEGAWASASMAWSNGPVTLEGGVRLERLRADPPDSGARATDQWPLVPRGRWWAHATMGMRPRLRLRADGDWGVHGWDSRIPSSAGGAIEVSMPLGAGWNAWLQARRGWGWDLAPYPTGISAGVGWSLKRPHGQEGNL